MKRFLPLLIIISLIASCGSEDDSPSLPRAMPIATLFNDIGSSGEPGFYVVKSNLEYRQVFGQDQNFGLDFTTDMMLIYISNQRSSSENYTARQLVEQEQNIVYQINFFPCQDCTRDAVSKVLIIGTDRVDKPVLPSLVEND